VGPVPTIGIQDENASGVHRIPTAPTQVLPEMLPSVPTVTPGITGPKPIVTAGRASFCTSVPVLTVEPSILTQGLVTATHTVTSVPASLVSPPKSELVIPATNVISGSMASETVCSVPTTEVSATTKQTQVNTGTQAVTSTEQPTSTPTTQAKLLEGPTPPSSGPSTTPIDRRVHPS